MESDAGVYRSLIAVMTLQIERSDHRTALAINLGKEIKAPPESLGNVRVFSFYPMPQARLLFKGHVACGIGLDLSSSWPHEVH
jgi:hypothetical protein